MGVGINGTGELASFTDKIEGFGDAEVFNVEDGVSKPSYESSASTIAMGEDGGGEVIHTMNMGEDGGGEEITARTMNMGEDGGGEVIHTMNMGEDGGSGISEISNEDGGGEVIHTMNIGKDGGGEVIEDGGRFETPITTHAMGEEGGGDEIWTTPPEVIEINGPPTNPIKEHIIDGGSTPPLSSESLGEIPLSDLIDIQDIFEE